jgi:glutamate formiminotransferase / 5-formyltetrahydrofolate cyclo-ligase
MPTDLPLLAVPNVSEGRSQTTIAAIATAFTLGGAARLLDVHADADHHRAVFTLAGKPGRLADALLAGAAAAITSIDVGPDRPPAEIGRHPHVGAVDVMPLVYLDGATRGAACAEALVVAEELGERLRVPVYLYGELTASASTGTPIRTRAMLRRGGLPGLTARIATGELRPDFGPAKPHPTAGVTLVAARPPLVAFNLELAPPAGINEARAIAAAIREGGPQGLPGLRAIGVELTGVTGQDDAPRGGVGQRGVGQVSMNVERPLELTLAEVIAAVQAHAEVARAELVGLTPRAALEGFPSEVPMPGFDPARHVIENALGL